MAESASRAFVTTAKDLIDAGNFGEAIKVLQEGLIKYPKMASARVLLGEAYWTSGDANLARVELEQVTRTVPDNFAAHRKLALVYRHVGDHGAALRSCQVVLQANPKDQEMRALMAELRKDAAPAEAEAVEKVAPPKKKKDTAPPVAPPAEERLVQEADLSSTLRFSRSPVAPPPSPAAAAVAPDEDIAEIDSETLAELYIIQGHREKGLAVYRRLAAKSPSDARLRARIEALEAPNVGVETTPPAPAESPAQAARKAHVRRLEGWLSVIRERRRM
jgi:tetratricopeptide (TPR) repeat protein